MATAASSRSVRLPRPVASSQSYPSPDELQERWASDQFLRCVRSQEHGWLYRAQARWRHVDPYDLARDRYARDARWDLRGLAALVAGGALPANLTSGSAVDAEYLASVVRRTASQERMNERSQADRNDVRLYCSGAVAAVIVTLVCTLSWGHGFGWAAAFLGIQALVFGLWRWADGSVESHAWIWILASAAALTWTIVWGAPSAGLGLIYAVPFLGATMLVLVILLALLALFKALGFSAPIRFHSDPYPQLVQALLHATINVGRLAMEQDEEATALHAVYISSSFDRDRLTEQGVPQEVIERLADDAVRERAICSQRALVVAPDEPQLLEARAAVRAAIGDIYLFLGQDKKAHVVSLGKALPLEKYEGPLFGPRLLSAAVIELENAAVAMESDFAEARSAAGRPAKEELRACGHEVATWLRKLQMEILTPSRAGLRHVRSELASGFVAAAYGDWATLRIKAELQPVKRPVARLAMRFLSRLPTVAVIVALAWFLPIWLHLGNDAATTLRVGLLVPALLALLAPQDALLEAGKSIQGVISRPSGGGGG